MRIGLKKFLVSVSLGVLAVSCAAGAESGDPPATDTTFESISGSQEVTTTTSASKAESLFSLEALADGQSIAASFEGSGSADLGSLSVAAEYTLIIASNNGPLKVAIEDSDGSRVVYERPTGTGTGSHQTGKLPRGNVTISVETSEEVDWLVAVTGQLAPEPEPSEDTTPATPKTVAETGAPGSGYNTLYIGHSFGLPFAERI